MRLLDNADIITYLEGQATLSIGFQNEARIFPSLNIAFYQIRSNNTDIFQPRGSFLSSSSVQNDTAACHSSKMVVQESLYPLRWIGFRIGEPTRTIQPFRKGDDVSPRNSEFVSKQMNHL